MAAAREDAEHILHEVIPAPRELDASLAVLDRDLELLLARYRAELDRRRQELANLESYYH